MPATGEDASVEQKKLAEYQERLRLALNAAEASTWDWDVVADKIFWSENLEPQLAMPQNSFEGHYAAFLELVHSEDRERVSEAVKRALDGGANYHLEFRMLRADGTVRWTETRGKVARDENGKPLRMSGIDLDITERKETEEQLRNSAAEIRARAKELQAILDTVPGMTFIAHDPSCLKMTSSRAAYEMLRLRPGANTSKSAPEEERPRNFRALKDGREIPADELPIQKAASTGREIRNAELTLEFDDRTSIDLRGNAVPLLDTDGTPLGAVGAFIDITDLKRTEQQLKETQRELHEAQRLAKSGSWIWYPKTDSVTWTQGLFHVFGRDPALPAPSFAEQARLFTAESWQRLNVCVEKTFKTGEGYELELDVIRPDGAVVRVVTQAEAARDASGEVVKLYGSVQDVSERKRKEDDLRLATQRFEAALRSSSITVFNQDLDLLFTWIYNPTPGFDAAAVIGKRDSDFLERVEDAEITMAMKRAVIDTGISRRQEVKIRHQGMDRYYDLRVDPLRDFRGSIVGVTCATVDLTDRRQMEEQLRASEERLRFVAERANAGVWHWDLIADTLEWSPLCKQLFGLAPDAKMSYARFLDAVHPDDRDATDRANRGYLRDGGPGYEKEYRVVWPDGTIRWIHAKGSAAYENGRPIRMAGIVLDVTERKQAEAALRDSEHRFRTLAENVQDVFWIIEMPERRTSYVSPAYKQLWGLDPEELYRDQRLWLERIHPDDRDRVEAAFVEKAESGGFTAEYRILLPNGSIRWVHDHAFPVRDASGKVCRITGVAQDITERKQAEEAARHHHVELERKVEERTRELSASLATLESQVEIRKRAEAALQNLSAHLLQLQDEERRRIARDLHDSAGQTLTAVKMSLSFLAPFVRDVPQASALVSEINELTDSVVRDIRTTSHLLHPPLLDEVGFQSAAQWYVEELAKRSGIKIRLELNAAAGKLTKDSELALFRVLQESLTNIVRHSGSKTADISFSSTGDSAILMIRDYGRGIPVEMLSSFNETGAGVGVGLGGMKQRIRERGGYFRVSSDAAGTCVTAILPMAAELRPDA